MSDKKSNKPEKEDNANKGPNKNANANASKEVKPNENANPKAVENTEKDKPVEKVKEEKAEKVPTPAEVSEKQKKDKEKGKKDAEKGKKEAQGIVKSSVYAKQYPAGSWPGDNAEAQKALAEEAALQLLADGKWGTATHTLGNGAVIHYIKKS